MEGREIKTLIGSVEFVCGLGILILTKKNFHFAITKSSVSRLSITASTSDEKKFIAKYNHGKNPCIHINHRILLYKDCREDISLS